MWYRFSDRKLYTKSGTTYTEVHDGDNILNGWHMEIPSGTDQIYVTAAIAYAADEYDDLGTNEWVTPAQLTENGINSATVFLYKRSQNIPMGTAVSPQQTLYYRFADGGLYKLSSGVYTKLNDGDTELNGWNMEMPATNGNPCYVIQAAALSTKEYDAIEVVSAEDKNDWSDVRKLVEDGKKGDDAFTIGLTNEHEDFLYTEGGTLISPSGGAQSQASLLEGSTPRTSLAQWSISCEVDQQGDDVWVSANTYTSSNAKAKAKITSGGLLTVEELRDDSVVVKVRAFYGYKYYTKEFTANKVYRDKYDIDVTPSSIAFNDSETWTNKRIDISADGVDLQSNPITVTISTGTSAVGQFRVFWGYVTSNGKVIKPSTASQTTPTEGTEDLYSTYKTVSQTEARTYIGIYFELRKITGGTSGNWQYRRCDYETVEIAKTKNGLGGLTFGIDPGSPIYLQQKSEDMANDASTDFGLPMTLIFSGKRGDTALSNVKVIQIPASDGVHASVATPNDNTCTLDYIVPTTVGQQTTWPKKAYFYAVVSYTDIDGTTKTEQLKVWVYITYLGTFKTEVKGDVETSIATSMGFIDSETGEIEWQNVATYIRSSSAAISTLERNVAGINLMSTCGFTDATGKVVRDSSFDEERVRLAASTLWSPLIYLEKGTYTLSYYMAGTAPSPHNATVRTFTGKPGAPDSTVAHSDTSVAMTEVEDDTYLTYKRYKGTLVLSSNRYVYIQMPATSSNAIYRWQLEKVGDYTTPTKWVEGPKYYKSEIKQTADEIDATVRDDLGQVGINISGSDKSIRAVGEKFSWKNNNGDQLLGMDNAGNATFAGTVRAKNFFHRLCVVQGGSDVHISGGVQNISTYFNAVSLYIFDATEFKSDAQEDGFLSEVSSVQDGDVLVWDAEHYPIGVTWGQSFDGARACSGDADEVVYINSYNAYYGSLYLPPAASCPGKKVTVYNKHAVSNRNITVYSADTTNEQIVGGCHIDANNQVAIDSVHQGQGYSIEEGASASFLAVNGGWLMLAYTDKHVTNQQ